MTNLKSFTNLWTVETFYCTDKIKQNVKTKLIGNRNSISTYQEPSYANNDTHTNKQIPWIWFNKCLKIPKLCSFTFLNLWEEGSCHLLQDLHLFPENIKIGQRSRPLGDMVGWTVTGDVSLQPETAQTTFAKKFSTNDNNRKMHLVLWELFFVSLSNHIPCPLFVYYFCPRNLLSVTISHYRVNCDNMIE